MLLHKGGPQANGQVKSEKQPTDQLGYRIVFFLWFLFLFEPARLVAYYTGLDPLKWLPTILLIGATIHWLRSPLRKYNYKWFMIFLLINLLGTVVAFWDGNWGMARLVNRQIFQFFMLGVLTFTFFDSWEKIYKLFFVYFLYFLFFAVWGIYGLKVSPINPSSDPGSRIIIAWHPWLDNRDGFGPLMVMGIAFSYYFYQATGVRKLRILSMICLTLCFAGVVISFGRGVFLGMVGTLVFILAKSKRKVAAAFTLAIMVGIFIAAQSIIAPGSMYWETMQSILDGTSEGTGADRKILWGFAWKVFLNNPVLGVGTSNFGVAAAKQIPSEEAIKFGYTQGRLWGRSLHCAPLTILCEYGLIGTLVFIILVIDFVITNRTNGRRTFAFLRKSGGKKAQTVSIIEARALQAFSSGLMASFVAFWVNGMFYEIIYASFFWNLIVLNRSIQIHLMQVNSTAAG
jgi:hypothetical protein